jgi:predicted  nucleic acid-binding Zn-ribbon protein
MNKDVDSIETLNVKLKSSQTNNRRLRFELEQVGRREYDFKKNIEYLEKQLQTTNDILQSVSSLLQIKVRELKKNEEVK